MDLIAKLVDLLSKVIDTALAYLAGRGIERDRQRAAEDSQEEVAGEVRTGSADLNREQLADRLRKHDK